MSHFLCSFKEKYYLCNIIKKLNDMEKIIDYQRTMVKQDLIDSIISTYKKISAPNVPVKYPQFMSDAVEDYYFELIKPYVSTAFDSWLTASIKF